MRKSHFVHLIWIAMLFIFRCFRSVMIAWEIELVRWFSGWFCVEFSFHVIANRNSSNIKINAPKLAIAINSPSVMHRTWRLIELCQFTYVISCAIRNRFRTEFSLKCRFPFAWSRSVESNYFHSIIWIDFSALQWNYKWIEKSITKRERKSN